jgi:hypothetical protein
MRDFMRSGLGLTLALVTFSSLQFGTSPTADSAPVAETGWDSRVRDVGQRQ